MQVYLRRLSVHSSAEVEIDREQLHKLDPQIEFMPGMPAEAFIATTERTLLEYVD